MINHEWHAQGHKEATRDAQSLTVDVATRPSGSMLTRRRVGGDTRLDAWELRYGGSSVGEESVGEPDPEDISLLLSHPIRSHTVGRNHDIIAPREIRTAMREITRCK